MARHSRPKSLASYFAEDASAGGRTQLANIQKWSVMPTRSKTKQAMWNRSHYLRHKDQRLADNRKRKLESKEWVREYRRAHSCVVCGEDDERCLDFHHRNPKEKVLEITVAANRGWSVQSLLEEANKCDMFCANCHRKFHGRVRQQETKTPARS